MTKTAKQLMITKSVNPKPTKAFMVKVANCRPIIFISKKRISEKTLMNSFNSPSKEPSVVQVTKVRYLDSFIRVYTDTIRPASVARCFYHEPLVVLDRCSIQSESSELLKRISSDSRLKCGILTKVLERLRSLPSLKNEDIYEEDVHVMPYEEVQLKVEPGSLVSSIKLKSKPIPYIRLTESLNFQFECASSAVAVELADNLKKNPQLFLEQWELVLECRGIAFGTETKPVNGSSSKSVIGRPTWLFNVSTLSCRTVESDSIVQGIISQVVINKRRLLYKYIL